MTSAVDARAPAAVLCGADGTLVDSTQSVLRSWHTWAAVFVTVDRVSRGEPDPEGHLLAARELGRNLRTARR